jgi:hypothetical protein
MKTTFTGNHRLLRPLLCLTGLLCFFLASPKARADEGDPPSRAARVSFLEGSVSLQPGGAGDWGTAAQNRPVTVGDKLWADKDARAELQVGQASIHMGSMTALSFLNLDENVMQLRIAEGAVNFRVRELREGDLYEVDTPNVAFTVQQAGAFRVDVSETGDATRITAIRGEGQVTAGSQTYTVHAGESAEFTGADNPQYQASAAPAPDGLDSWAAERDMREDNSTSARYVSREVPGYSDLDDNGTWSEQPDVGPVWYPNDVPVGWAPYSYGYWNWIGPWGWTWIGYEPWGYAPFHYGRWGLIGGRWGWYPGPYYARPFFGPAFVGFVGGPGFRVGFGFGGGFGLGVGWFPLGFREPFFPGFRASPRFVTAINTRNTFIRNTTILNSPAHTFNYAYAHNVNAVTATTRSAFVSGQAINRGAAHLTEASLRGATVSNRTSFTPTRQSSLGATNMSGHVSTPPASVQNRSVIARTAPGAAASHSAVRPANSGGFSSASRFNSSANTNARSWEAQGNTNDRGRAPQGFGSNAPRSNGTQSALNRSDRPPWASSGSHSSVNNSAAGSRSYSGSGGYNGSRSTYSNSSRSYEPESRSYTPPSRTYSSPRSSYPASRSYSAPSSSHTNSAPRSSGGGSSHGGSAPHGGGGSHGGGHH